MKAWCVCALAVSMPALAQTAESSAPPPAGAETFHWKRVQYGGYVDVFYDLNYNHPDSGLSQLQAFNLTADRWSLASATASLSMEAAPVGFRVDFGAGRVYDAFWLSEPSHTNWTRHLLNAYVSVRPAAGKGLQFDIGKFVTSAGAEVTESHLNWNYSRSLLFAFGPYYHTGLRATVPLGQKWTAGAALVTGWNTVRDNNTGKTLGLTGTGNFGRVQVANTFYTGPENTGTSEGWRHFHDSVITVNIGRRVSAYANVDVGSHRFPGGPSAFFWGVAGAARIQLTRNLALSPRLEHYSDRDGFWTGAPTRFREFTLTAESRLNDCLISRLELRRDWADRPFFETGANGQLRRHQMMLVAGVMVVLKPGLLRFAGGAGH